MKSKKYLANTLAIAMVAGSAVISPVSAAETNIETLIGKNRIETSIKISKDGWKSAETVILVNSSAIPDALTATPLAHAKNAPILLTDKDKLNKETADEIKRLGAKNVIIIGGDAVLSSKVEEELKALKLDIDRIKGATREETALSIAKRLDGIKNVSEIAVVNGTTGLADAVSVAAAAAEKGMPIILANPKKGLSASEKFIKDEAIKASYIIGGTTALPENLVSSLPAKQRIEGADRNDTNAKVIEKFYGNKELDNLYLAKDGRGGEAQLIDALAVGALAAKNGAPVLIASKKLNEKQEAIVNTKKVDTITQVGGNGNEGAFNHLKDIEKEVTYKVETVEELNEALEKANANDIIEFTPSTTVSSDVTISTNNAVEVNLKGNYTGTVTTKAPNADIVNKGTVSELVVENGKNTTVTNTSSGKIDKIEVGSSSENVKVENNGTITQVENNATGTNIDNNGTITKPVTGTTTPTIDGNKPGGGTSSGGGSSSGGGTVTPEEKIELEVSTDKEAVVKGEKINLRSKVKVNGNEDSSKVVKWESSNSEVATVDEKGVVTTKKAGDVVVTATVGGERKEIKLYVGTEHANGKTMEEIVKNATDGAVVILPKSKIVTNEADSQVSITKDITLIGQGNNSNGTDISDISFYVMRNKFSLKNLYARTSDTAKVQTTIYASGGATASIEIEDVRFERLLGSFVDMWSQPPKENPNNKGNFSIKSSYIELDGSNKNAGSGLLLWGTWGDVVVEDNEIIGVNYVENNVSARNVQIKGFERLSMKNNIFDCGNTEDMTKVTDYETTYDKSKYNVSLGHDDNKGSGGEMKNATITGNTFKNTANGIRILPGHSVDNILLEKNTFENVYNAFSPVNENGIKGIVFNNVVFNNNIINKSKVAYNMYYFDGATYSNCQIQNNTMTNVVTPIHTNAKGDDVIASLKSAFTIDGNTNNGNVANEIEYETTK